MDNATCFEGLLDLIGETWIGGSFIEIYPTDGEMLCRLRDEMGLLVCGISPDLEMIQQEKRNGLTVWIYHHDLEGRKLPAIRKVLDSHGVTSAIVYPDLHENFPEIIGELYDADVKELYLVTDKPATYLPMMDMRYSITHVLHGHWRLMKSKVHARSNA